MDSPCLATEFCLQRLVYYRFVTPVQVARAARRQDDSGLFPGLEESKAPHPEREEKADPPCPGGAGRDHSQSDQAARRKRAGTHDESPPPLSWTDVFRPGHSFGLQSLNCSLMAFLSNFPTPVLGMASRKTTSSGSQNFAT